MGCIEKVLQALVLFSVLRYAFYVFRYQWFPNERVMGGFGTAPTRRGGGEQQEGVGRRGYNWGQGFVLGDS